MPYPLQLGTPNPILLQPAQGCFLQSVQLWGGGGHNFPHLLGRIENTSSFVEDC